MNLTLHRTWAAALALAVSAGPTLAQTNHTEVEPNSNKTEATIPTACLSAGHTLTGMTIGTQTTAGSTASNTVDYWRIRTCALPLGIYRHRLVITTTTDGHTGTLRGLNQTGTAGSGGTAGTGDVVIQASNVTTVPARMNQWYGFGKAEELYYRVTGNAATTANYVATLETTSVAAAPAGSFLPGAITINAVGQGHTTDTDLWVYNGNLDAIAGYGNDDPLGTMGSPSTLTRTYTGGTYYVAITDWNFANNQTSPPTDEQAPTGNLTDFPNVALNNQVPANLNCAFTITDSSGTPSVVLATKAAPYEVLWFQFTVGGASAFTAFCPGDGTQATACPCAINGSAAHGCANSAVSGGALLAAAGATSPDTVVLTSSGELPTVLSLFVQGDAEATAAVFGDGLRCIAGNLNLLYVKNAVGGTASAPQTGDPAITIRSASLGDSIAPGTTRSYQVYYRDPLLTFCPNPSGNSWNISNGIRILW